MAGGLLNILSWGTSNILVFGNPKKSIFHTTYKSITNFGIQRIRLDMNSNSEISLTEESTFTFKIKRHAELFGDCYLVVNLPDIWSPLINIEKLYGIVDNINDPDNKKPIKWMETGFKWIEELGSNIINEVEINSGGQCIGKYTGEYFSMITHRDYPDKVKIWKEMTGDVPELNDPANAHERDNCYPNAMISLNNPNADIEPSIRGRKLYIPLKMWFTHSPMVALPLVATQYDELKITVKIKPIKDLYMVRDIQDISNAYPYVSPNYANPEHMFYRFLQQPQTLDFSTMHPHHPKWNPDIHIMGTYYFLSNKEKETIAKREQKYLVRDVYHYSINGVVNNTTTSIDARGLVSSFMFRLRRSDAFLRNEWSNYSNWPYNKLPYNIGESKNPGTDDRFMVTGKRQDANIRDILKEFKIILNGKDRENILDAGVYHYIETYSRTPGCSKNGVYIYNFGTNTDLKDYQPYGGMNLDKFPQVELFLETITPPLTKDPITEKTICADDGSIIGYRRNPNDIYEYTYDLDVYEERYNVVIIKSGSVGMLFAR